MTDFTVWETAPFNSTIDHILQRYHNVHRAQFEELVPLAQKVAQVHADTFPAEVPDLLAYMQNELLMHMMKEERMLFPTILSFPKALAAAGPVCTLWPKRWWMI